MTEDERYKSAAPVVVEAHPPIAIIRLNRPAERNQLSISTLDQLDAAVSWLLERVDIKSIIFTGTGDVFASGANIRELRELAPEGAAELARRGQQLFQKIADAKPLTIAAINGYCMGGGLDLALACALRHASSRATLAHPGARLGIITGWGGTQRLPRLIGEGRALEILLTARRVTSSEALEIGLVNRISDPVLAYSCEVARRLSG
ncbi:MAG TPA: enoyl-CoA hydratase/isomerase family protein [Pyrinomonadaceae bacterium]|jgi:enoyl-CoA hydratase